MIMALLLLIFRLFRVAMLVGNIQMDVRRRFPSCRVEADDRETAIAQLQAVFLERSQHIEAIPWSVPVSVTEPAWMKFAGIFQDDPDCQAIMEEIRAERESEDGAEVDLSYYQ
jgi:hypothetical protein